VSLRYESLSISEKMIMDDMTSDVMSGDSNIRRSVANFFLSSMKNPFMKKKIVPSPVFNDFELEVPGGRFDFCGYILIGF